MQTSLNRSALARAVAVMPYHHSLLLHIIIIAPTIGGGGIMFCGGTSVVLPLTSVLSERISMKLATNIHHVSGQKAFKVRGQMSRS